MRGAPWPAALGLALSAAARVSAGDGAWQVVAEGLAVGRFPAPVRSSIGDSVVTVVRVDPSRYEFRVLSAKLLGLSHNPTAIDWVERHGVLGAINAGMFQADHRTSVGYMRDGDKVNNRRWNRDNAVFAAGPRRSGLPAVQILDRTCQDVPGLADGYRVLVQNIRMIDCQGRNTWAHQDRKWSTACVGTDGQGRVLLIHVRSPYATHDLVEALLALPLGLRRLMYVEGGPEASLYVKVGGRVVASEVGSFETGFREADDNRAFWPLPNVIAFAPR